MKIKKFGKYLLLFLALFISGWYLPLLIGTLMIGSETKKINSYSQEIKNSKSSEFVFVYLGCYTCEASNMDGLAKAIKNIKISLVHELNEIGVNQLHTIGISKDKLITQGINHLSKSGPYKEIMIGNEWNNLGHIHYMYDNVPGPTEIPQVLILHRKYKPIFNTENTYYRGIQKETVLVRKVGYNEIIKLSNSGKILQKQLLSDFLK